MRVSIKHLPDEVIDDEAIETMEVVHHAPENGLATYELKVTYRIPEADVIDGEVIEGETGTLLLSTLPTGDFVAPQLGVNFVEPWTIVRDE